MHISYFIHSMTLEIVFILHFNLLGINEHTGLSNILELHIFLNNNIFLFFFSTLNELEKVIGIPYFDVNLLIDVEEEDAGEIVGREQKVRIPFLTFFMATLCFVRETFMLLPNMLPMILY